MTTELVQRLRNLHAHSGDPDTVLEAAQTLENLEGACALHLANVNRMSEWLDKAKQHIDRLEELCRMQAADIERLSKPAQMTDDQARKVLAAVMEVQP